MTTFNPSRMGGTKLVYCTRNAKIIPAKGIWPNREDLEGKFVLVAEHFVHDEWHSVRTSLVVDVIGNDVHTLNSIYRVVDDSVLHPHLIQEVQ